MSSFAVENLRAVAKTLDEMDMPVSAGVVELSADRMERMEELIISLQKDIEAL